MTTLRCIRWVAVATAFVVLPLLVAAVRLREFDRGQLGGLRQPLSAQDIVAAAPALDPTKPTVAIILGADLTEITDALGPYEMFSRADAFNVYTELYRNEETAVFQYTRARAETSSPTSSGSSAER